MLSRILKSNVWLPMVISAIALVAAVACAEEAAEPAAPLPAKAAAQPAAPQAPAGAPGARQAAAAANTPLPAQAAAEPQAPKAAAGAPSVITKRKIARTGPAAGAALDLHDDQTIRISFPGSSGIVPWRTAGHVTWTWSTQVFGTLYQNDPDANIIPYIALSHTANDDSTVFTFKLREDAVFQDGTPITAADIKAYWEHGAKPEFAVAWGGASLTIGVIKGWEQLRTGEVTEAEGLVVIDDHTLEMTLTLPSPAWPFNVSVWHTGISKMSQVLADTDNSDWVLAPIAAGPFSLRKDADTGNLTLTRVDLVGEQWWGEPPIIEKWEQLQINDRQVQLIMFENEELDLLHILAPVHNKVLDPNHPLHSKLHMTPYAGIWYLKMKTDMPPIDDLLVRKALAHGVDMRTIVKAVWGGTEEYATGLTPPGIPCYNPDSTDHPYDPDLARQELASSTYGSADNLPAVKMSVGRPLMINMAVALKEYWKDNLGLDLSLLARERGMPRQEGEQFYRISMDGWIPDPTLIIGVMTRTDSIEALTPQPGGYPVIDGLLNTATSMSLDDPNRCAAFHAIETEVMDQVYFIPIKWKLPLPWLVQPWLIGFTSSYNFDFASLPTAYILKH